jgi:hypothetical protein
MSFRRDSENLRAWHRWVTRHQDTLIRCRLPDFLYSDRLRWFRFLEHGGWDHESSWGIRMLSPLEAAVLSDFVVSEYSSEDYRLLLRNLDDVIRKI